MMRDHSPEDGQKDIELGYPDNRMSADQLQNGSHDGCHLCEISLLTTTSEAQQQRPVTASLDFAYDDAIPAGQEAATGSRAPSLRSLPASLRAHLGTSTSESLNAWPQGDSDLDNKYPSRPFRSTGRVKTSVLLNPDTTVPATDQAGLSLLDIDKPGTWVVEHHRDELLRKVENGSAG